MKKEISEKELFETIPVPRAVATLANPTIISQVVTMIYNLADTFFVGQIGNPYMVAAVSLHGRWTAPGRYGRNRGLAGWYEVPVKC